MNQKQDWYKWGYYNQGNGNAVIRRYRLIAGKTHWESYSKSKYLDFNEDEIQALIRRLNVSFEVLEREAKSKYDFDHAYINARIMSSFESLLINTINSPEHIKTTMSIIKCFTLEYFVRQESLPNPAHWKKYEAGFGDYLLSQKLSSVYLQRIIQTTNKFLKFIHNQYPDEVRLIKLEPLSNRVIQNIISKNKSRKKFITEEHFNLICSKIVDQRILASIKLSYHFGLRRAEVLAVNPDCLYEDALQIEKQVGNVTPTVQFKKLKTKEQRLIPYWFITPQETYKVINEQVLMHPVTLGITFSEEMKRLKLPYQFHDLRRTFITNALRKYNYLDVKLAAGHSDLATTNKYIQDDRQMSRKKFSFQA